MRSSLLSQSWKHLASYPECHPMNFTISSVAPSSAQCFCDQQPGSWLIPLPCLFPPCCCRFGRVRRRRPSATEGTEDRCGLHNNQQISCLSDPNPANVPAYMSPRLPRPAMPGQTVTCRATALQAHFFLPVTGQEEPINLQLHWKVIICICQPGQSQDDSLGSNIKQPSERA